MAQIKIGNNQEHYSKTFRQVSMIEQVIEGVEFEDCSFNECDFTEAVFKKCRFIECSFTECNLSVIKIRMYLIIKSLGLNLQSSKPYVC